MIEYLPVVNVTWIIHPSNLVQKGPVLEKFGPLSAGGAIMEISGKKYIVVIGGSCSRLLDISSPEDAWTEGKHQQI